MLGVSIQGNGGGNNKDGSRNNCLGIYCYVFLHRGNKSAKLFRNGGLSSQFSYSYTTLDANGIINIGCFIYQAPPDLPTLANWVGYLQHIRFFLG